MRDKKKEMRDEAKKICINKSESIKIEEGGFIVLLLKQGISRIVTTIHASNGDNNQSLRRI